MREFRIHAGHAIEQLRKLPDGLARCCVTSPPYYGLRDYGSWRAVALFGSSAHFPPPRRLARRRDWWKRLKYRAARDGGIRSPCGASWIGQLGLEPTPEEFVRHTVEVFREVRRVLKDDGTLWLNLGDSYVGAWGRQGQENLSPSVIAARQITAAPRLKSNAGTVPDNDWGLKRKDLMGIPWRVAFALQADGWFLRQDIIWHKPNAMPESVKDRCTNAHEHLFLLSKRPSYFYDQEALREPDVGGDRPRHVVEALEPSGGLNAPHVGLRQRAGRVGEGRNKRSVWSINTRPFNGAHFAAFPPELPDFCVRAGSQEGDTVLDPFSGAGTTGMVALRSNRNYVGIELSPDYVELSRQRILEDAPLLNVEKAS